MKKIFTLLLLALVGVSQLPAQIIKVYSDAACTQEIADNGQISFTTTDDGEEVEDLAPAAPYIKNVSDETVDIRVTVSLNTKGIVSWCGITTNCAPIPGTKEVREATLAPGETTNMELHAAFIYGSYKTATATVQITVDDKRQVSFFEHFVYADPNGITETTVADGKVSFANNALSYSFTQTVNRTISVFGIDGKLVKRAIVNGTEGSVSLSDLQKGAYIYAIADEKNPVKSGKILVK